MNPSATRAPLSRRTEYTFKVNTNTSRHGWLRLTPAYSLKLVEELLAAHTPIKRVIDPFCGTGTTALCAAQRGHEVVTIDINPFLVWFTRVKTAQYSLGSIEEARIAGHEALQLAAKRIITPAAAPPIFNIERWWYPEALEFLRYLRAAIDQVTRPHTPPHDLLLVTFCRTLIELSNAAFNHQSLSFNSAHELRTLFPIDESAVFESNLQFVLRGARENPLSNASVLLADSRQLRRCVAGQFDLVITSPPYANRISYIRELRPYMYWLGFLKNGKEAGELDWAAIGGTWGSATSRLINWERAQNHFESKQLDSILSEIKKRDGKSGKLIVNYLAKYFDDLWAHFCELQSLLNSGAELHYVIGNSTFYGILIPTEQIVADMLSQLGFSNVIQKPIRKRNSNKSLVEFDVTARWR